MWICLASQATKESLANLSDHLHVGGSTVEERYTNVMKWLNELLKAVSDHVCMCVCARARTPRLKMLYHTPYCSLTPVRVCVRVRAHTPRL